MKTTPIISVNVVRVCLKNEFIACLRFILQQLDPCLKPIETLLQEK